MLDNKQKSKADNSLLKQWLQNSISHDAKGIIATAPTGVIPLSFAQKRLWFLQQWMPDSSGYHLPIIYHIKEQLDVNKLEDSFRELINRHSILRTVFIELEGEPIQVILESLEFVLPSTDISMLQIIEREKKLNSILKESVNQLFDLKNGPLFRAEVIQLGIEEWIFSLSIHHIITDGWSNGILMKELIAGYEARLNGIPLTKEMPLQYYDYARWQTNQYEKDQWKEHMKFWKEYLEGAPALIELPLDYPRPTVQTSRGAVYEFNVPESTLRSFRDFCLKEQVTLVMAFLALFKLLLYRYSGQEDLLVGLPVFNRPKKEMEGITGFFANTLVIRTRIPDEKMTFKEWLHNIRDSALSAYEHQELPFEKLVEMLQPERSTTHNPIIQAMLSVGAGSSQAKLMGEGFKTWSTYPYERSTANFDLTLEITELEAPKFSFVYRTDLFKLESIQRLAKHFITLLQNILVYPNQSIAEIEMLSLDEKEKILNHWNETSKAYPENLLHELIEQQAQRSPDAQAICFEETSLSYQELNERANQLAHFLQKEGINCGQFVGVCMERSIEMVVALLGVLKAGAAYVPIDPTYPVDRLTYMLEDSGVAFLITQNFLEKEQLHSIFTGAIKCLNLNEDWSAIETQPKFNPKSEVTIDSLAYMIYTSGSTGKPKGAMNTHKAINNQLLWMQEEFKISAEDRLLQKTPFSFDVSIPEIFWPLSIGASLYLAVPEGHKDPSYLIEAIQKNQITIIGFVPSMLTIFLEDPEASRCTSLQRVLVAGEALTSDLQNNFFGCFPSTELYNLYGPTETAVHATSWKCNKEMEKADIPIGRPAANTQVYILDRYLSPTPIGVAGELHIGGVQVGKGYYNRSELTNEKFILNPFKQEELLYKSGDLARFTTEGVIEYLGRLDHQVKLRGFRIELGEIEAAIRLHPKIREVVLDLKGSSPDDKQLVAYFTTEAYFQLEAREIRSFLGAVLPEYMVPSFFIQLTQMPLLPNGKIDKRSLSNAHNILEEKKDPIKLPSSVLEIELGQIWKDILRISEVGIEDNFFEIGGHSLLVIKVRSKVLEKLHKNISMMDLFRFSTIQSLAQFMNESTNTDDTTISNVKSRAQKQREAINKLRGRR
ncbi:non-ribosomal peptide synthetase [Paenibacillus sp. FSL H3-0286]|uniref:non-ribosomal peptide synthetase n=1 Tax=Paenibacillus sp. FSL H3-0286 TaxID=2921427 RepID=UPI003250D656